MLLVLMFLYLRLGSLSAAAAAAAVTAFLMLLLLQELVRLTAALAQIPTRLPLFLPRPVISSGIKLLDISNKQLRNAALYNGSRGGQAQPAAAAAAAGMAAAGSCCLPLVELSQWISHLGKLRLRLGDRDRAEMASGLLDYAGKTR
jgi:hypothetical protein